MALYLRQRLLLPVWTSRLRACRSLRDRKAYATCDSEMNAILKVLRLQRTARFPQARLLARAFHSQGKRGDDQITRLLCEIRNKLGFAVLGAATAALEMEMRQSPMAQCHALTAPAPAKAPATVLTEFNRKWHLFGQIGAGSFGRVHIGMCEESGQVAAVKIVKPNKQNYATLEREVKTLQFVRAVGGHPCIIDLHDVYVKDQAVFLVTELVRGGELYDHIAANGALSESVARTMIKDVSEALRFLHHYGVVHRDVKPENILLTRRNSRRASGMPQSSPMVKLADFGSAGPTNADFRLDEVGTSAYLPPEVLQAGKCTTACDMWALGCVLYIALSGAHPFDLDGTATDREVEHRAKTMPVVFDFDVWQHVSSDAKDLIVQLLHKDPAQRPTAEQVLEHPWMLATQAPKTTPVVRVQTICIL